MSNFCSETEGLVRQFERFDMCNFRGIVSCDTKPSIGIEDV